MRFMMRCAALAALVCAAPGSPANERPQFSIGAIADAQYAAEPDSGQRLYHTTPSKLAAAVTDLNGRNLAFVVHLGDFIDKDWASFDALLRVAAKLRHRNYPPPLRTSAIADSKGVWVVRILSA